MVWLELSRRVFYLVLGYVDEWIQFLNTEITIPALPPFWEDPGTYSILDAVFGPGVFLILIVAIVYHFLP